MTENIEENSKAKNVMRMNRFDLIQSQTKNASLVILAMAILIAGQTWRDDPDLVFVALAFCILLASIGTLYFQTKKNIKELKQDYDADEQEILHSNNE